MRVRENLHVSSMQNLQPSAEEAVFNQLQLIFPGLAAATLDHHFIRIKITIKKMTTDVHKKAGGGGGERERPCCLAVTLSALSRRSSRTRLTAQTQSWELVGEFGLDRAATVCHRSRRTHTNTSTLSGEVFVVLLPKNRASSAQEERDGGEDWRGGRWRGAGFSIRGSRGSSTLI